MASSSRSFEQTRTEAPPYRPGDQIWIHRSGAWRTGVVLAHSPTAVTIRYRVTGSEGTGVDTVLLGRPELAPRAGGAPPPEPPTPNRSVRTPRPVPRPGPPPVPPRPQRQPAGRGTAGPGPRPPAAGQARGTEHVVELRVFVRGAGGRPHELPLRCAVDRRRGIVRLRLGDGPTSQFDLLLARAAGMLLHEAVVTCMEPQDLRLWIQR
ncbi:hypothetical protein O7623_04260 [Solwaraspora sp. WMMD791]|uniref:hypothetical protein n=1 Tax=Solwaraspora sp. WMMD791 TaxID=3016086 RepID=UPI00249A089F|nr:hypothetical protein [Solwaraspora sp. WMMD791]WFE28434.1 hypothetical protein O7623_04260 [Solwaraspora sp. WMMD791]